MSGNEELLGMIMRLDGVRGAILVTSDGQVELAEGIEDVEAVASCVALSMMTSVSVAAHLNATSLRHMIFFTRKKTDVIVVKNQDSYLAVVKESGASLTEVLAGVRHTLGEFARRA